MGSRSNMNSTRLTEEARAALANRERAYIAASRRKDRSDEARLESALRGSEIHKELTGKALIITREIVMNGGEYLEEDPAFERLLARRRHSVESPTIASPGLEAFMNRQFPDRVQFVGGYPQDISPVQQTRSQNAPLQLTKETNNITKGKQLAENNEALIEEVGGSLHNQQNGPLSSISPHFLHNLSISYGDMMSNQNWMGANSEPLTFLGQQDLDDLLTNHDGAHTGFHDGHRDISLWENEEDESNQGNEHGHV